MPLDFMHTISLGAPKSNFFGKRETSYRKFKAGGGVIIDCNGMMGNVVNSSDGEFEQTPLITNCNISQMRYFVQNTHIKKHYTIKTLFAWQQ